MRCRKLGRIDKQVTELSLGTWGLSGGGYGPVEDSVQDAVIERACELGINLFDTADTYANGEMERKLGQRLAQQPDSFIITKIGTDPQSHPKRKRFDAKFLQEAFERSRERIGRDKLDLVLLHNPSAAAVRDGEATAFMEHLVSSGQLLAWGVSAGSVEVLDACVYADPRPHVVEIAYNAFCGREMKYYISLCENHQIAVLARSVLAHGLLAGLWSMEKVFERGDHRIQRWTRDQFRRRLSQMRALSAVDRQRTRTQRAAALHYVLSNELIASAILGPRDLVQLDQLVREVAKAPPYFDRHDLARIEQRLEEVGC